MPLDLGHIRNSNTLKSIYNTYFHYFIKYGTIFGVTLPAVGRFSLHKRKSAELWSLHNSEFHVEVYLNNYRFYQFHGNIYFH